MSAPAVISVNGRRTRVRIEGDPADPPMLLLHGVGRSLEDWAPQYPRLAGSHRTIALDVPGFGFSTLNEPATLKVLARGVIDTLDTLGERRPLHVVGNSLGGAIALQLLVLDPYRVASLALVNSVGFDAEVAFPLRLLAMPVLGRLATRRITRTSARFSERMIYADPKLATKDRIEHALAIARQPDAGVAMLETTRELVAGRGINPAGAPN
jgi:pimeloyl-ACP methyl ester carboxylesterase